MTKPMSTAPAQIGPDWLYLAAVGAGASVHCYYRADDGLVARLTVRTNGEVEVEQTHVRIPQQSLFHCVVQQDTMVVLDASQRTWVHSLIDGSTVCVQSGVNGIFALPGTSSRPAVGMFTDHDEDLKTQRLGSPYTSQTVGPAFKELELYLPSSGAAHWTEHEDEHELELPDYDPYAIHLLIGCYGGCQLITGRLLFGEHLYVDSTKGISQGMVYDPVDVFDAPHHVSKRIVSHGSGTGLIVVDLVTGDHRECPNPPGGKRDYGAFGPAVIADTGQYAVVRHRAGTFIWNFEANELNPLPDAYGGTLWLADDSCVARSGDTLVRLPLPTS